MEVFTGDGEVKILCVSLLRFGDLIQHLDLVSSIRAQNENAEIHFLINDNCQSIAGLLPGTVHVFPRQVMQYHLVEETGSSLSAMKHLHEVVQTLNAENFNKIYNMTHNQLSYHLMSLLKSSEQFGARPQFAQDNLWAQYLNGPWQSSDQPNFSLVEVLARSMNLPIPALHESRPVEKIKHLVLQVLTSDQKKNWGFENFKKLIQLVRAGSSEIKISILGAPDEKEAILAGFKDLQDTAAVEFQFLKWIEVQSFLRQADLLVTGDTSILHLAAQIGTPTLSLFMGSGNIYQYSPRQKKAVVLAAQSHCYPCPASQSCEQPEHFCSQSIKIETVYNAIFEKRSESMYFVASTSTESLYFSNDSLARHLEKAVWQFWLDEKIEEVVPPYASTTKEYLNVIAENESLSSDENLKEEVIHFLRARKNENENFQLLLEEFADSFRQEAAGILGLGTESGTVMFAPKSTAPTLFLRRWRAAFLNAEYKSDYSSQLKFLLNAPVFDFRFAKQIKQATEELSQLLEIEIKILTIAENEMKERSSSYVARTGRLSSVSAEAP